jgi:NTE family protein
MRLGLVMGGGGTVGIAWETGVLAGLQEACGFDPTSAAVIMGSSAGSVTGAQAACGRDFTKLADLHRRPPKATSAPRAMPDFSTGPQAEIMQLLAGGGGDEDAARLGALAMQCETALPEVAYVESFRSMVGTDEWPAVDLRVTTCECETGRGIAWSRATGIGLVRAVASSCAIPGFFPTVTFEDRHYTDGPRGRGMTGAILSEVGADVALFIGPNVALGQFAGLMEAEFDDMRARGIELQTITGGDGLARLGGNLMDASLRPAAVEAGLEDGRAAANALAASVL